MSLQYSHVTPCMGHFRPQGHSVNKISKGSLDYAKNIKALGLAVSGKKFYSCSPYISLWACGGSFLASRYNLKKNLHRNHFCDATYQLPRLYALWFRTRRFVHDFPI